MKQGHDDRRLIWDGCAFIPIHHTLPIGDDGLPKHDLTFVLKDGTVVVWLRTGEVKCLS